MLNTGNIGNNEVLAFIHAGLNVTGHIKPLVTFNAFIHAGFVSMLPMLPLFGDIYCGKSKYSRIKRQV